MIADFLIWLSGFAIVFGVPFVILVYPSQPPWPKSLLGRFLMAILIVWILLVIHRCISLPHVIRQAEANGKPRYDAAAVNVGYFFFGWIYGVIGAVPSLIILFVIETRAARKLRRQGISDKRSKPRH